MESHDPSTVAAEEAPGPAEVPAAEPADVDPPGEHAAGTTTTPPEKARSTEAGSGTAGPKSQQTTNQVFQAFLGAVEHVTAVDQGSPWQQRDGVMDQGRLASLLRHFVAPPRYDDAFRALNDDHVVSLHGRAGLGKYAGGVHLLREVTDEPIILLAPVAKLKYLANREFTEGYGYLIVDWQVEARSAETEFAWLTVRNQVRDAGAFLVITSTSSKPVGSEVHHIEWEAPDLRRVLKAYTHEVEIGEDVIDEVLECLSANCSMTDFVDVARRLGSGEDRESVLAHYDDGSAADDVRTWFEDPRSRRETLVVATLAFAAGEQWQTFERLVSRLEEEVAVTIPEPAPPATTEPAPVEAALPEPRRLILANPLVAHERIADGTSIRQTIKFRKAGYRQRVLLELWNRYDSRFWDAVRGWACAIVDSLSLSPRPAMGLAVLASINFDEVCDQFLDPWARGSQGWPGQLNATYVLWSMCTDDATAPIALGTANRWANHGDPAQRGTAALTFSGLLGVYYPNEALRQLWQLIVNASDGSEPSDALALLFANLTYLGSPNAGKVISMLNRRVDALEARPEDTERRPRNLQRLRNLTMASLLDVLSIREASGAKRPVIFMYLHAHQEDAPAVARLWAALLRNRLHRQQAIVALWEGLNALPQISKEPRTDANTLGEALAKALPEAELGFLARDLSTIDMYRRKGKNYTQSMAVVLLEALERLHSHRKVPS